MSFGQTSLGEDLSGVEIPDPQYARPIGDSTPGVWLPNSGTVLAQTIDETVESDSDWIYTTNESMCNMKLWPVTDSNLSSNKVITIRARSQWGNSLTVTLLQNSTTIATRTISGLTTSFTDYQFQLTPGETSSITDYSNLYIQLQSIT